MKSNFPPWALNDEESLARLNNREINVRNSVSFGSFLGVVIFQETPLAQHVRMGILDPNFIFYLIAVTLPFIILGLLVYLLYF